MRDIFRIELCPTHYQRTTAVKLPDFAESHLEKYCKNLDFYCIPGPDAVFRPYHELLIRYADLFADLFGIFSTAPFIFCRWMAVVLLEGTREVVRVIISNGIGDFGNTGLRLLKE